MQASVHEAKTHLSKLLEAVARGERVVITRRGHATQNHLNGHSMPPTVDMADLASDSGLDHTDSTGYLLISWSPLLP